MLVCVIIVLCVGTCFRQQFDKLWADTAAGMQQAVVLDGDKYSALTCHGCRHAVTIDGHEDVPENDEASLTKAVSQQPVSVAICASQGLQFYSSGIVGGKCCTELDHGVLAVGYGTVSAWTVRSNPDYRDSMSWCIQAGTVNSQFSPIRTCSCIDMNVAEGCKVVVTCQVCMCIANRVTHGNTWQPCCHALMAPTAGNTHMRAIGDR